MQVNGGVIKQFEHSMAHLSSTQSPEANNESPEITNVVNQDARKREITLWKD